MSVGYFVIGGVWVCMHILCTGALCSLCSPLNGVVVPAKCQDQSCAVWGKIEFKQ